MTLEIEADVLKTRLDNIPNYELGSHLQEIPKEKEIITICAHGNRSLESALFMNEKRYKVLSLKGGMAAWNNVYNTVTVPLQLNGNSRVYQMRRLGKGCVSYVVISEGEAVVVDPSTRTELFLELAQKHNARITHVMDTHQHADHISGAPLLAEATGASLYLNPVENYQFSNFKPIEDGGSIQVGEIPIHFIVAPGHTRGSTIFQLGNKALITGDILFVEGVGRPDLRDQASSFAEELYSTYQERLKPMSQDFIVLPGHFGSGVKVDYNQPISATLGELKNRISLFEASKEEFIDYVTSQVPTRPPNAQYIVKINRGEIDCDPETAEKLEEGPNRCAINA
jgi:glyoxylase-like metal-dependent hydrolase (beta-lactamase superfamily II)